MDASQVFWEKWQEQVKGLFPKLHGHQQKQLALMVAGMVVSGCGVRQRVAEDIQQQGWSQAKMSSIERRLSRFVANEHIVVSTLWKTFLGEVLPYWNGKKLTFVLDCTPYNAQFSIVYLGLLVHSRVLPVAWAVMPGQEKWEERQWDIVARLLDKVCVFLPEAQCTLLADRGLAGAPLVRLCVQRKWHYVLRICQEHTCRRQMGKKKEWSGWSSFKSFIHSKGQQWYGRARLWQEETLEASVSACWEDSSEEAWLLMRRSASGKSTHPDVRLAYARRVYLSGYVRRAAGTLKQHSSRCEPIWTACCWHSFWPFGGWVIWQPRVSIMANVTALTAMIAVTRAFFAWGDSGSWISCAALATQPLFPTACRFTKKALSGLSLYAFSRLFSSHKSVGERGYKSAIIEASSRICSSVKLRISSAGTPRDATSCQLTQTIGNSLFHSALMIVLHTGCQTPTSCATR
jgi:hypothetical protein